ncbi:MAG TPA: hypothetical protein PKJ13_14085 [bacterium]|nr:hypothetical protein [bacterium]HOY43170.1 hypothetical protein [bacterium]HPG84411.1 hypothetical protein [bacterium]HPM59618.1 hypothetical protein [bacterium]
MRRLILLSLPLLILAGCGKRELPTPPAPEEVVLSQAMLPEMLGPMRLYRIEIGAAGEVDSVLLEAVPRGTGAAEQRFYLYDDGGARHAGDGDVVAFDNIFSQQILWQPTLPGFREYELRFQASRAGRTVGEPLILMRSSGDQRAPEVAQLLLPDTLRSGFSGSLLFQAVVIDSSGPGDVARVELTGSAAGKASFDTLLYDDGSHGDPAAGDYIYSLAVDRTFGARKQGAYTIRIAAVDRSGQRSPEKSAILVIVNTAPLLTDLNAPAAVQRPAAGASSHLVSVRIDEPQGLQDINRVLLRAYNPDGTGFNNNPFVMYDNGLALDISRWDLGYRGDLTDGDGVYSMTVIFDAAKPLGVYRLTFTAEDWAGNQSELLTHTITLD